MSIITRKKFLFASAAGAGSILLFPQLTTGQPKQPPPPPLKTELVKEFVGAAHRDLEKVKTMLQETPDLLNATYNWKSWDWEDAIGGAGHMGLREVAVYLIEQGARPSICVAAMLGKIDVVKAYITAFPQMKDAVGAHRISLLRHAKAGGEQAKEVLEYLQSIGAKE